MKQRTTTTKRKAVTATVVAMVMAADILTEEEATHMTVDTFTLGHAAAITTTMRISGMEQITKTTVALGTSS